jgi:pseudouridine-5'-phosphate glycosidase
MDEFLTVAPEIIDALADKRPVVALESTLITHGLPYPVNLETASEMESAVRDAGAVPAIIAIVEGRIRIGLTQRDLESMLAGTREVRKVSRRDLAFAISQRLNGGTTVAATMICARLAGIRIFATGGIGGVHRGAADTMDVSADLEELSRTPVAVICAGAKAILDLPRTYEYLETKGVPVIGHRTNNLPGFYTRETGLPAPMRLDTPDEIALLASRHWALGLSGGLLIANPPPEKTAMIREDVEQAIELALEEAKRANISGAALTPFLLDHMTRITEGRSLEANVALILNNARLGGEIARAFAALPA